MQKAEYGDIIYTKHYYYKHFGIYINENCVIHYDGKIDDTWLRNMYIRETNMDKFLAGKDTYYVYRHKNALFNNEETVKRARRLIGENKFNLIYNNCEHMSKWCKFDKKESIQVKSIIIYIILLIIIIKY